MIRFFLVLSLLLGSHPVLGDALPSGNTEAPITYSRSTLTVLRSAATPQPPLIVPIEVRDGRTLYRQEGWINVSGLPEGSGLLLAFARPEMAPIIYNAQYAPLDILMIDSEGRITQIAPSLVLAHLQEEIYPASPVQAFLLMPGGSCERLAINPGDEVQYKLFKKPPPVLSSPNVQPLAPATPEAALSIAEGPEEGARRTPAAQPQPKNSPAQP